MYNLVRMLMMMLELSNDVTMSEHQCSSGAQVQTSQKKNVDDNMIQAIIKVCWKND